MTAATKAREAASHFEAKKTGFGQAQDGWSLTLRIQDNDVPDGVAKAKKGTRYMVALVEIGDDEQPINRKEAMPVDGANATVATTPRPSVVPESAAGADISLDEAIARRAPKSPAQIAGYLCTQEGFRVFLRQKFPDEWHAACDAYADEVTDDVIAAECVRGMCNVQSRADITGHNVEWHTLQLAFRLWENHPELEDA